MIFPQICPSNPPISPIKTPISPVSNIAHPSPSVQIATVPGSFAAWPQKIPSIMSRETARPAEFSPFGAAPGFFGKYDNLPPPTPTYAPYNTLHPNPHPVLCPRVHYIYLCIMEEKQASSIPPFAIKGNHALQLARELSKLPEGDFHIVFFPYSRRHPLPQPTSPTPPTSYTLHSTPKLRTLEHCRWRTQLPHEAFDIDSDNYFLFQDSDGNPKMCYRYLIRFMAFPNDGYKLHPIKWLE